MHRPRQVTGGVRSVLVSLLALALFPPGAVRAQYDGAPEPAAWALEGVTVVHFDGREEEGMTLVVRGGLIETLRPGAPVPSDARRIEWADGPLRVYPGFVDGEGSASTSLPSADREGVESWSPTREVQNFTPHRRAAAFVDEGGSGLTAQRRGGIIASVVYPGRGPFPGQASLLLHRIDASTPRALVLRPSVGLAMAFQGAQGAYPGTLMAVHAFIRQSFMDAAHHRARQDAYFSDTRGLDAGSWDEDLDLLHGAASGDVRVLFQASGADEVRRVLALADEIGFRPVVVGGIGIGALAPELASRGIPVLLSTDLPEPDEWDPDEDEDGALSPPAARERERLLTAWETAGLLEDAGVTFALTSGGGTSVLEGVRRYVEYGLSRESALRALTITPAGFFGVPELVRIEEGMAANFIVTDGDLFEDGRGIAWTFVSGRVEEGRAPRGESDEEGPPAGEPGDLDALVGTWEGEIGMGPQGRPMVIEISRGPDGLEGRTQGPGGEWVDLSNLTLDGSRLSMDMPLPGPGGGVRLTGTVEGDSMSGTGRVSTPQGEIEFNFQLQRVPRGDAR